MDKAITILILIAIISVAGFFVFQEQPTKKNLIKTGLIIAKTIETEPSCENGSLKDLREINVFGLNGSEYFLCSDGLWTGPQQSTNSIQTITFWNKTVG